MESLSASPKVPLATDPCPCGSGKTYGECCQPVLADMSKAADAEALMRARFTAHVVGNSEFLHKSYLPDSKKPYTGDILAGGDRWTRLVINSHEVFRDGQMATVDFTAYYKEQGVEVPHDEKAEFLRQDGTWIYNRAMRLGPAPVKHSSPKVGRNDPCPCGSGKKYKHCCAKA
jgi:SEC-C motif-containing protein